MDRAVVGIGARREVHGEGEEAGGRERVGAYVCPWAVRRGTILVNVHEPSVKNGITTRELETDTVSLGDRDRRVGRGCKIPRVNVTDEVDCIVDGYDSG